MPWRRPHQCKRCRRHERKVGRMSARGLCQGCCDVAMQAEQEQLRAHSGPMFDHWRRQVARSVGALLLDDV